MDIPTLGHLARVDPREVWNHEALGFTPWLRHNIGELGQILGLDLDLESEVSAGAFAVDLAGKDLNTGRTVIVENQLEQTDHSHLGQIMSYASGLDAEVIVWVSPRFRDEHRQALDWLNQHTDEGLEFFGVELEVLRIGDSVPAPNFRLVAQPNQWAKDTKQAVQPASASEKSLRYQNFFADVLEGFKALRPTATNASRVAPQNWFMFGAGRTGLGFAWAFTGDLQLKCELYIDTGDRAVNKTLFDALHLERAKVEASSQLALSWERMDDKKASRIAVYRKVDDLEAIEDDAALRQWAVATMGRLYDALRPMVKRL